MAETKKRTTTTTKKATAAVKKATSRRKRVLPTHEEIAERAYYLSLEGSGDPMDDWLRAERELVAV